MLFIFFVSFPLEPEALEGEEEEEEEEEAPAIPSPNNDRMESVKVHVTASWPASDTPKRKLRAPTLQFWAIAGVLHHRSITDEELLLWLRAAAKDTLIPELP